MMRSVGLRAVFAAAGLFAGACGTAFAGDGGPAASPVRTAWAPQGRWAGTAAAAGAGGQWRIDRGRPGWRFMRGAIAAPPAAGRPVSPAPPPAAVPVCAERMWPVAARRSEALAVSREDERRSGFVVERRWRVLGCERVTVPAGTFDAVVLEYREVARVAGGWVNSERHWIDTASGAPVRVVTGLSGEKAMRRNWDATRLDAPGPKTRTSGWSVIRRSTRGRA